MHANLFDPYQDRQSLIHGLDPRVKVGVTLLYILSNVLMPDGAWPAFLLSWGVLLAGAALARIRLGYLLKRSIIALPFALAAVTVVFTLPGEALASGQIFGWRWVISDTGLVRFASILLRSWLSVQMAIALTASTPFPDILHALRHFFVPRTLVAVSAFMYRYLFVLADEALRLLRARDARSARLPGQPARRAPALRTLAWRARIAGNLGGQLFLRSYERSDRVYNAMLARGYTGESLTLNPHRMGRADWGIALAAVAALLAIQLIGRLG